MRARGRLTHETQPDSPANTPISPHGICAAGRNGRGGATGNAGNTQENAGDTPGNTGKHREYAEKYRGGQGKNIREIRKCRRRRPGNRLKSNQPQSILRLIFHISRDKGTRSGNSLSYPVRRIAATAGTIKKAADRASSVCRKQECYLKVGVVNQKTLGCAVPALGI